MNIGSIRNTTTPLGCHRVEADVDGEVLWFSSSDAQLIGTAEAFGAALLLAAAHRGESLVFSEPVDTVWYASIPQLLALSQRWWGTGLIEVAANTYRRTTVAESACIGQCFTGGVDSFYALLHSKRRPHMLVFAHGFDIPLSDERRLAAFLPGFREIAAAVDAKAVVIRTNLREHPSFRGINWERTHGGALACLGHLLAEDLSSLVIPSSYPYREAAPWGSHWELDPLHGSSAVSIIHADASLRRGEKLRVIANHPLVKKHLRVCWENRVPEGNCSACEKCVRTMLVLAACGSLENCSTFDLETALLVRVNALPRFPSHLQRTYMELREMQQDPFIRDAVDALIRRSENGPKTPSLAKRAIQKLIKVLPRRPPVN